MFLYLLIFILINNFWCFASARLTPNCTSECKVNYFNRNRDCKETTEPQCRCITFCCLSFNCRNWNKMIECRKKCGADPNRYGLEDNYNQKIRCNLLRCEKRFFDDWAVKGADGNEQRNCIKLCCYAFDCRQSRQYCRQNCGLQNTQIHFDPKKGIKKDS